MRGGILALCLICGMVWFAGCNPQDAGNIGADTKKLGQDIGPLVGNAALHTKVSLHLSMHKGIDMSGIHIESSNSTVTVGGHVRDAAMRNRVINTVHETTGVDRVIDKLAVEKSK